MSDLHIRILMGTRDGERFVSEQLRSFLDQSHANWDLEVSDDGSCDRTRDIVRAFGEAHPRRLVHFGDGPRRGPGANFLTLLMHAVETAPDSALAFSDQDDVWLPEKLSRAAEWMEANGALGGAPLAWTCRTILTDARLAPIGESRCIRRPPSFGNALVQNILAGNTLVLSPAAARLMSRAASAAIEHGVCHHDWWCYQMLTGAGAHIHCEDTPLVLYRQHRRNLLGHNGPLRGRILRIGMVLRHDYAGWVEKNLAALRCCEKLLTPQARKTLRRFMQARRRGGVALAASIPKLGLHRQSAHDDHVLRLMAVSRLL
ncbi:MAG: glycosyltransferase [Roseovarius sp.]|nr:glycosyltransferase [Roseovarius sp.]